MQTGGQGRRPGAKQRAGGREIQTPINMSFGYCLDKEKRVFLEVLFYNQQKDLWFFYKTVLGISKIPLHLQGRRILKKHAFMFK